MTERQPMTKERLQLLKQFDNIQKYNDIKMSDKAKQDFIDIIYNKIPTAEKEEFFARMLYHFEIIKTLPEEFDEVARPVIYWINMYEKIGLLDKHKIFDLICKRNRDNLSTETDLLT